jgi:site-specific recombinase XerD
MDNNNVSIGVIQEILGHENRTTTEIYLHSVSGTTHKAMQVYERVRMESHSNPHSKRKGLLRLVSNPELNA